MARNAEKANAMFNRFIMARREIETGKDSDERRPYLASECSNLREAERWRNQIIREMSKCISDIQNGSLGEHRIRDLNDQANKLMREKHHWEKRIKELGGPNYEGASRKLRAEATEGSGGYLYFGAAKDLPGVRDLLAKRTKKKEDRGPTRYQMLKMVDADYYGFRDDDDGLLEPKEAERTEKRKKELIEQYEQSRAERKRKRQELRKQDLDVPEELESSSDEDQDELDKMVAFKAHVPLPSQADIQAMLLQRRKQALLAKYSAELQSPDTSQAKRAKISLSGDVDSQMSDAVSSTE